MGSVVVTTEIHVEVIGLLALLVRRRQQGHLLQKVVASKENTVIGDRGLDEFNQLHNSLVLEHQVILLPCGVVYVRLECCGSNVLVGALVLALPVC